MDPLLIPAHSLISSYDPPLSRRRRQCIAVSIVIGPVPGCTWDILMSTSKRWMISNSCGTSQEKHWDPVASVDWHVHTIRCGLAWRTMAVCSLTLLQQVQGSLVGLYRPPPAHPHRWGGTPGNRRHPLSLTSWRVLLTTVAKTGTSFWSDHDFR